MNILNVSNPEFSVRKRWPIHTDILLENYVHEYMIRSNIDSKLTYLPVHWCDYSLCGNKINEIVKSIPNGNYWTVSQWDFGLPVNITNCLIFSTSGCGHVDIPMTTTSHECSVLKNQEYLASFVGTCNSDIRSKMISSVSADKKIFIDVITSNESLLLSTNTEVLKKRVSLFEKAMQNSIFALCPVGMCNTSFRFYEAIDIGSIPVYISDKFILPFSDVIDWDRLCIKVKSKDIKNISSILRDFNSIDIKNMREYGKFIYDNYLSMNAVCNRIARYVSSI